MCWKVVSNKTKETGRRQIMIGYKPFSDSKITYFDFYFNLSIF